MSNIIDFEEKLVEKRLRDAESNEIMTNLIFGPHIEAGLNKLTIRPDVIAEGIIQEMEDE